ncbi:MAG: methyltransferase domain-containing protein [Actinobacteria bacterium]|nr:methyltransferase domain-containing protein [Actinomycetota bacterium]MBA3567129.1 methyltransferase domain-containing protein [Actinomycetota bacterium]
MGIPGPLRRVRATLNTAAVRFQAGSRSSKWELYRRAFPPRRGERVLDLGVSALDDLPGENYFVRRYPFPDQLTAVGIDDLTVLRQRYPEVTFVTADGLRLPFADDSFDVVHSNAVIEHVGEQEDQERFVTELVRVGRAGFITTPNRWFPIETHCKLPLLHWLPRPLVMRLSKLLRQPDLRWRLLGARGFRRMFPPMLELSRGCTRILGWPVTLVVVYRRR